MPTAAGTLIVFPGALGDFICFLPTLAALRARHAGRLCLVAQSAFLPLVQMPDVDVVSIDRRAVANLFASGAPPMAETISLLGGFGTVHSWTGFGNPEFATRLSAISAGPVFVHRFRGMQDGEPAVDYYARCVGSAPIEPVAIIADDPQWMAAWQDDSLGASARLVVMHPGSGSPRKNWLGFDAVRRYWQEHHDDRIVILSGPAEENRNGLSDLGSCLQSALHNAPFPGPSPGAGVGNRGRETNTDTGSVCSPPLLPPFDGAQDRLPATGEGQGGGPPCGTNWRDSTLGARERTALYARGLELPQVTALLRRSALYVGNDSGISHLAGAVGARGIVLFGPSDPRIWAPRGAALRIIHAPEACATCGPDVFCTHRLPIAGVINTLEAIRGFGPT